MKVSGFLELSVEKKLLLLVRDAVADGAAALLRLP